MYDRLFSSWTNHIVVKNIKFMVSEKWDQKSHWLYSNEVQASFCTFKLNYREKNKMTVIKCMIVVLAFLVSRVTGILSIDEDTSSRDRIESVSRNFEKYWITSKGRNEKMARILSKNISVTACPKSHHKSRRAGRRCCSNRNGCVECPFLSQGYRCQNYYDS